MDNFSQVGAKYGQDCPNCQTQTKLVEDHAAGDLICEECGLVVEARAIDEGTEWRTFSNNDSQGADPNRVGGLNNPLLRDGGLSTVIGKDGASSMLTNTLSRVQHRTANPDRQLLAAFRTLGEMADRLGLVGAIKDRANEIYCHTADIKSIRGRSMNSILAACLYMACRQENSPRTFKEICAVAQDTNTREIGRCFKFILKALERTNLQSDLNQHALSAVDLLRRYCSVLALPNDVVRAVITCVQRFLDYRGNYLSSHKTQNAVAAAGIYLVTYTIAEKPEMKRISQIAGVAETTIKSSYEDMYPHRAMLMKDLNNQFNERLPPNYEQLYPLPKAKAEPVQ